MFDDCKGEKIQELLASFSTVVLRKALVTGHNGTASIAARLATAKRVTSREHESFLPLAVAHRASLTAILRRKRELREKYQGFGLALDSKEKELDQRFETIVSAQDTLDKNPISDHTASRVTQLFEQNWQGDARMVNVITRGEEHVMKDSLLDESFSTIWPRVCNGTFDGASGTSWQGLLEDLEKRVADQEARLNDWKEFKETMKDHRLRSSPNKENVILPRTQGNHPDMQKQRDFVFSPRKSPRKSDLLIKYNEEKPFPAQKLPAVDDLQGGGVERMIEASEAAIERKSEDERKERESLPNASAPIVGSEDADESWSSEVSDGYLHYKKSQDGANRLSESDELAHSEHNGKLAQGKNRNNPPNNHTSDSDSIVPSYTRTVASENASPSLLGYNSRSRADAAERRQEGNNVQSKDPSADDLLAEQIVSMTINAAPTPAKPKLSLAERTRQSMAFASPSGLQKLNIDRAPSPSIPPIAHKEERRNTQNSGQTTLLERTRQSISLVPPKPKGSRKSMLDRRLSKVYPTNQFETPGKQLDRVKELTPPEELFSLGAGYDSVFKSRPKVTFSPTPSPAPGGSPEMTVGRDEGAVDREQRQPSPLARMIARG